MYMRKTYDTWEVQGDYGYGDGFETLCCALVRREAMEDLKAYRANAPEGSYCLPKGMKQERTK
jgi:hypothetical protein